MNEREWLLTRPQINSDSQLTNESEFILCKEINEREWTTNRPPISVSLAC